MWIMDPAVNIATSPIPMPDYLLDAVHSIDGVDYAVLISVARILLPSYAALITFWNLGLALALVVIAAISGYFGVRRVLRIEPFDIFRG